MTNSIRARTCSWACAVYCLALPAKAQNIDAPPAQHAKLEAAVYGGAGTTYVRNNEDHDIYDDRHFGLGLLASSPASQVGAEQPESLGFTWQLGLTAERRSLRTVLCDCDYETPPPTPDFSHEADLGVRVGAGNEGHWFGFRAGLLMEGGIQARVTERLILPDVAFRVGPRRLLFFTVGLGAYNASTSLRPGLYGAVSVAPLNGLVASLHYGFHFANGAINDFDPRIDLALDYALSRKLSVGLSIATLRSGSSQSITEGCATVGLGF